jgi:uncharacterized membrane protein
MSKKKPKTAPSQVNPIGKSRAPFLLWLDSRQAEWILVGAIILVAAALRFQNITSPILWQDELDQIGIVTGRYIANNDNFFHRDVIFNHPLNHSSIKTALPIGEMWKQFAIWESHPPFYYTLFYFWRKVFGDSFISVRLPSTLASIAAVLMIFLLGKQLFDKWTGMWAALLMTLSTPQIIYAHEVRHYAFLIFLGICTAYIFLGIEKKNATTIHYFILGILIFLLSITHYFSFGFLFALAIYTCIKFRKNKLYSTIGSFFFAGSLFLITWGHSFWQQFFSSSMKASEALAYRVNPNLAINFLPQYIDTWFERIFFHLPFDYEIIRPPFFVFVCLLPIVAIYWRRNLLLPWLCVISTAGFVLGLDFFRQTFHFINIRYTLLASPWVYLIFAAGIATGRNKVFLNSIAPGVISVILLFNLPTAYKEYRENWNELSEIIRLNGSPTDAIILPHAGKSNQLCWPHFLWTSLCYYNYNSNRPMVIPTKPITQEMISEIGFGRSAWIITRIPEFPQSANTNWPSIWIPGCRIIGAWLLPSRATLFHVILPSEIPESNQ